MLKAVAAQQEGGAGIFGTLLVTGNSTLQGSNNVGTILSGTWNGSAIDLASYATGTLQAAQFPALTGDVTTSAGSLATSIKTNVALAGNPTTTTPNIGDNTTKISTTAFVTTAINNAVAGINPAVAVQAATTQASDTSGFTYNNGTSGVGATLTGSVNTAVSIDGYAFTTVGQRLLVKNDTQSPSGAFNGVYSLTQVQTGILPPIFTRATDYNQPSNINSTGSIPVINGTANGTTSWLLSSTVNTMGTDPLTYAKFSMNPSSILPLNLGGTNANLTASNGGILYSNASALAILSGTATAGKILQSGASGAPTWSTPTYPSASATSGNIIVSDGTNFAAVAMSGDATLTNTGAITVAHAPASGITGTTLASNVVTSSLTAVGTITTGVWNGTTIDIAHGGTGQTSLQPWFDPRQFGTLKLWLAADDPAANGTQPAASSSLASWVDKSSNGYTATASGTARPTYGSVTQNGLAAVSFNGSTNYMSIPSFAIGSNLTIFVAFKSANNSLFIEQSATVSANNGFYFNSSGVDAYSFSQNSGFNLLQQASSNWLGTNPVVGAVTYDGSHVFAYKDGLQVLTQAGVITNNTITDTLYIGSRAGSSLFTTGDIYEIIIYSGALAVDTIQYIAAALKQKWATGTLSQNTTGSAATLTTARAIYGNNFDGSTALTQIIASTYGGTGNGFTKFSGPATSEKTFTLPDASANVLTDNAAVTLAQGGTSASLTASNGGMVYSTASALAILAGTATAGKMLQSGATAAPSWSTPTYPSASGTAGKILRADGTNNAYSTATFADTYTASNLLYANGANTVQGLATANNGTVVTDGSGVPSISSTLPTAVQNNITHLGNVTACTGLAVQGTYTNSSQPAFFAYRTSTAASVTGDGTAYTIICDTKSFDQGTNYNASTGIFTAPTTGKYLFNIGICIINIGAAHTAGLGLLVTSGATIDLLEFSPINMCRNGGVLTFTANAFVSMTAADTAKVTIAVSNGTKVVSVYSDGSSTRFTWFGGNLVC